MNTEIDAGDDNSQTCEDILAAELELVGLLRENSDIFVRHPDLLTDMKIPHASGKATSLIERQVEVLRQKLKNSDRRLCDLMDVARDNERLNNAKQALAVSLFSAGDMDDVINTVIDMLRDELTADFAVIRLLSDDEALVEQQPDRFIYDRLPEMRNFKTVFEQRSVICGKPSDEQKRLVFGDDAESIKSAAMIPLAAGSNIGVIGLGSAKAARFTANMGVDFLHQIGELVSAAIIRHR